MQRWLLPEGRCEWRCPSPAPGVSIASSCRAWLSLSRSSCSFETGMATRRPRTLAQSRGSEEERGPVTSFAGKLLLSSGLWW